MRLCVATDALCCTARGVPVLNRIALGKRAKIWPAANCERQGYAILARRYRTRYGEIDIVARDGATLVFVEVKARASAEFGPPAEAVTPRKQRTISLMASEYLLRHQASRCPCRFDVVAVMVGAGERAAASRSSEGRSTRLRSCADAP